MQCAISLGASTWIRTFLKCPNVESASIWYEVTEGLMVDETSNSRSNSCKKFMVAPIKS